ncbi:serine/threonine protein kinase, partial [Streptomyces sp. NPDC006658]
VAAGVVGGPFHDGGVRQDAPGGDEGERAGRGDDLSRWSDPTAPVDGVFVGVGSHGGLTAAVAALTHPGCRSTGSRAFADAHWHGLVRSFGRCPDGGSVTECALVPAGGAARPQVYVQIRRRGDGDATDGVLRSLRVA